MTQSVNVSKVIYKITLEIINWNVYNVNFMRTTVLQSALQILIMFKNHKVVF